MPSDPTNLEMALDTKSKAQDEQFQRSITFALSFIGRILASAVAVYTVFNERDESVQCSFSTQDSLLNRTNSMIGDNTTTSGNGTVGDNFTHVTNATNMTNATLSTFDAPNSEQGIQWMVFSTGALFFCGIVLRPFLEHFINILMMGKDIYQLSDDRNQEHTLIKPKEHHWDENFSIHVSTILDQFATQEERDLIEVIIVEYYNKDFSAEALKDAELEQANLIAIMPWTQEIAVLITTFFTGFLAALFTANKHSAVYPAGEYNDRIVFSISISFALIFSLHLDFPEYVQWPILKLINSFESLKDIELSPGEKRLEHIHNRYASANSSYKQALSDLREKLSLTEEDKVNPETSGRMRFFYYEGLKVNDARYLKASEEQKNSYKNLSKSFHYIKRIVSKIIAKNTESIHKGAAELASKKDSLLNTINTQTDIVKSTLKKLRDDRSVQTKRARTPMNDKQKADIIAKIGSLKAAENDTTGLLNTLERHYSLIEGAEDQAQRIQDAVTDLGQFPQAQEIKSQLGQYQVNLEADLKAINRLEMTQGNLSIIDSALGEQVPTNQELTMLDSNALALTFASHHGGLPSDLQNELGEYIEKLEANIILRKEVDTLQRQIDSLQCKTELRR